MQQGLTKNVWSFGVKNIKKIFLNIIALHES